MTELRPGDWIAASAIVFTWILFFAGGTYAGYATVRAHHAAQDVEPRAAAVQLQALQAVGHAGAA